MDSRLLLGDCLELLKGLPDESVDAVVTDPPYGLSNHTYQDIVNALTAWLAGREYVHGKKGFMGKRWDGFVPGPNLWRECLRVLKPGGHVLCAAGTRTVDLMGISLRLGGFEIRDTIEWLYGEGFPKSLDISKAIDKAAGAERKRLGTKYELLGYGKKKDSQLFGQGRKWMCDDNADAHYVTTPATSSAQQWQGFGTSLKPAHEPFILARKPIENGLTIAENCLKWRTGGLDIDGCRIETDDDTGRKQTTETPKFSGKYNGGKNYYTPVGTINGNHPQGRFPANLIHDGSDCVLREFPQSTHIERRYYTINHNTPNQQFTTHKEGQLTPAYPDGGGSTARFFYCAKAGKREKNEGLEGLEAKGVIDFLGTGIGGNGHAYQTKPNRNHHPTVKPKSLMKYLVKLISREGQVVLDPFMGSGTTGVACRELRRRFIGMELHEEYFNIARQRILGEGVSEEGEKEEGEGGSVEDEQLDLFRSFKSGNDVINHNSLSSPDNESG